MQYKVNTTKYKDSDTEGGEGNNREPGAYYYKITRAIVRLSQTGTKKEYIEYDMKCNAKGATETFDVRYKRFYPNSEAMAPQFDAFLITHNIVDMVDIAQLIDLQGVVVLRKAECFYKGDIATFLDEVVSFFDMNNKSAQEIRDKQESKKMAARLKFVEDNPVKFLSKSEREEYDSPAGSAPSQTPKSGTPGPSPAPNEDIQDLPF